MSAQAISNYNTSIGLTGQSDRLFRTFWRACRAAITSIPFEGPRTSHPQVGEAYIAKFHQEMRI